MNTTPISFCIMQQAFPKPQWNMWSNVFRTNIDINLEDIIKYFNPLQLLKKLFEFDLLSLKQSRIKKKTNNLYFQIYNFKKFVKINKIIYFFAFTCSCYGNIPGLYLSAQVKNPP